MTTIPSAKEAAAQTPRCVNEIRQIFADQINGAIKNHRCYATYTTDIFLTETSQFQIVEKELKNLGYEVFHTPHDGTVLITVRWDHYNT